MNRKDVLFVTGDLLKPSLSALVGSVIGSAIEQVSAILRNLKIESETIWKSAETEADVWANKECTPEILEIYLEVCPDFLESASCVVGWELPTGLCNALEARDILWVSFTNYIWSPRADILLVTSNDPDLLAVIHHPLPRFQPAWNLEPNLTGPCGLIIIPPLLHRSRLCEGKLRSLNDYFDQVLQFFSTSLQIYAFPAPIFYYEDSCLDLLFNLKVLNGYQGFLPIHLCSPKIAEFASFDPFLAPMAETYRKPFRSWAEPAPSFAFIPFRQLKSPLIWAEILQRTHSASRA